MATPLIPNVINADVFDVQADARDGRFTWQRGNGKIYIPGLVILGKPSIRFVPDPLDPAAAEIVADINVNASMDDVNAWAFAARWWISFAWQQYADALELWQQLEWAGTASPDVLMPSAKSLGGRTYGILEVYGESPPWLLTGSWTQYFTSLVAQVVAQSVQFKVSTLIEIQIAMRSVAMMMQSMSAGGPEVQRSSVSACDIVHAWRTDPTPDCMVG